MALAYLDETDIARFLAEALTTHIQIVLTDETVAITCAGGVKMEGSEKHVSPSAAVPSYSSMEGVSSDRVRHPRPVLLRQAYIYWGKIESAAPRRVSTLSLTRCQDASNPFMPRTLLSPLDVLISSGDK